MSKGKLGRVSVSEFKGMDASISPTKLEPGIGTSDMNGRRGRPFVGSWGPRRGYQRMCDLSGGGILRESSAINAIFQFNPGTTSTFQGWRGDINGTEDTSTAIWVTDDGTVEAYTGLRPRE